MDIVSCTSQPLVPAAKSFRILPSGLFRSNDGSGRPQGLPGWIMDASSAAKIIASANTQQNDFLIDYNHESLSQPGNALAAGWFKRLEWRNGDGLYVTDARWTRSAYKATMAGEYRYVSPVFVYDPQTGKIDKLISIGITNTPALDGLTDLMAATAARPAMAPNLSSKDVETMKHVFGEGIFEQMAAMQAHEAACDVPPPGVTANDHAKMQAVFGKDYALRKV